MFCLGLEARDVGKQGLSLKCQSGTLHLVGKPSSLTEGAYSISGLNCRCCAKLGTTNHPLVASYQQVRQTLSQEESPSSPRYTLHTSRR